MHILLIHGQGRTPLSMSLLGWRLKRQGYKTLYFGYFGFAETFYGITQRFIRTVRNKIGSRPYAIVAHSLGGIVARAGLPHLTDSPPRHLIMLAPPNHPSLMAKKLRANPLYKLATGDSGQKLANDNFYAMLPLPTVPTTIIAGVKGWPGKLSPFGDEINDTLVSLKETKLEDYKIIQVSAAHSFIMNSRQVTQIIQRILAETAS